MKILIVEDDAPARLALRKILKRAGYEVELAVDGEEASELLKNSTYDAIITDWMMPRLDGLELIKYVRQKIKPVPVIIVITALNLREAREKAMDAGADEYIVKPFEKDEVVERIGEVLSRKKIELARIKGISPPNKSVKPNYVGVGVAASTGGPHTVLEVFSKIEPTNNAAFFIVLHGPTWMLESFKDRLQSVTKMKVLHGAEGLAISPGTVYLAPGNRHMLLNPEKLTLHLDDSPPENFVRPAADPLFRTIANTFHEKSMSVVLTGMGKDGSIGSGYIAASGGMVIAQDPATAVIAAMPQTVIDLRIAKEVAGLDTISGLISKYIKELYTRR